MASLVSHMDSYLGSACKINGTEINRSQHSRRKTGKKKVQQAYIIGKPMLQMQTGRKRETTRKENSMKDVTGPACNRKPKHTCPPDLRLSILRLRPASFASDVERHHCPKCPNMPEPNRSEKPGSVRAGQLSTIHFTCCTCSIHHADTKHISLTCVFREIEREKRKKRWCAPLLSLLQQT
jgi:hypothetical protein